jgi:hypothetical protein
MEVKLQDLVLVGDGPLGSLVVAVQGLGVVGQALIVADVLVQRVSMLTCRNRGEKGLLMALKCQTTHS